MKKIFIMLFIVLITPLSVCANNKKIVTLNKCVDGDTTWFNLNDEVIKTRFLAIDTPESTNKIEEYGKEASKYTCDLLEKSTKIEIEYDSNSNKTDKYDRHLVWVFVDGELLQEKLIEKGYAEVKYIYGDYMYTSVLEEKQEIAKDKKLNIWSNQNNIEQDYIDKLLDNPIVLVLIILIFLIIVMFNKKIRNKVIRKSKNYIKKEVKKKFKI